jgi:hypothetical protein
LIEPFDTTAAAPSTSGLPSPVELQQREESPGPSTPETWEQLTSEERAALFRTYWGAYSTVSDLRIRDVLDCVRGTVIQWRNNPHTHTLNHKRFFEKLSAKEIENQIPEFKGIAQGVAPPSREGFDALTQDEQIKRMREFYDKTPGYERLKLRKELAEILQPGSVAKISHPRDVAKVSQQRNANNVLCWFEERSSSKKGTRLKHKTSPRYRFPVGTGTALEPVLPGIHSELLGNGANSGNSAPP